jgi:hypothetical protein
MAIKFPCPKCEKPLRVKDELAGKRGKCPGCGSMVNVPAAQEETVPKESWWSEPGAAKETVTEAPTPPPVDVEAEAAAALSDEPAQEDLPDKLEFECPMCGDQITMPVAEAGKRAPCPMCGRIIKVPEIEKKGPTDWRRVGKGIPSGAKQAQVEAPKDSWGMGGTTQTVSREALEEADALPTRGPGLTLRQKITRGVLIVAAIGGVVLTGMFILDWWNARGERNAMEEVARWAEKAEKEGSRVDAGALYCQTGVYYSLGDSKNVEEANNNLKKAISLLTANAGGGGGLDRDAMLMELSLRIVDLGGPKEKVDIGQAISWDDVHKQIIRTLGAMSDPEARRHAVKEVTARLIAHNEGARALPLTAQVVQDAIEVGTLQSVVGIELHKAGNKADATRAAAAALNLYEDKDKPTPIIPEAITLAMLLNMQVPKVPDQFQEQEKHQMGRITGLVLLGKKAEAMVEVNKATRDDWRLKLLLAYAAEDPSLDVLSTAVSLATTLRARPPVSVWVLLRLVDQVSRSDLGQSEKEAAPGIFMDTQAQARARLLLLRAQLEKSPKEVEASVLDTIPSKTVSYALAALELTRRKTRDSSGWLDSIENWDERTKAFGTLGKLLGLRDRES